MVMQQVQAFSVSFEVKIVPSRKASARSVLPPVTAGVLLEASTEIQAIDSTGVES